MKERGSAPRLVVVQRVNTQCNLACGFCAFDRRLPFERISTPLSPVSRFARLLARYAEEQGRDVHLSLLGGEPMLWQPLPELERNLAAARGAPLSSALHAAHRAQPRLSLGITTNGTTLGSAAVRARLLTHYTELTVSVDAVGPVHDELRAWPGGFAQLARCLALLAEERRRGASDLKLRVNTVLMRQTAPGFVELCRTLARLGVDEISFNQLGGLDRPEFFPAHALSLADLDELAGALPALREELARSGTTLLGGPRYLEWMRRSSLGLPHPGDACRPGDEFWFVDERGRLSPCSFTSADYGISIDELSRVDELVQLPARFRQMRDRRRAAPCEDCRSTQLQSKWSADGPLPPRRHLALLGPARSAGRGGVEHG